MICFLWTTAISALDFNLAPALSCGPFARKFQSNFRLWENRNQFLRSWCHSCLSAFVLGRTPIRLLMHNLDFVVNWFQILCHQNSPEWCTDKSGDMTKRCSVTIPAITVNGFIYWMPMQHCNMNVGLCLAKIQGLDLILMLTCIIFLNNCAHNRHDREEGFQSGSSFACSATLHVADGKGILTKGT